MTLYICITDFFKHEKSKMYEVATNVLLRIGKQYIAEDSISDVKRELRPGLEADSNFLSVAFLVRVNRSVTSFRVLLSILEN